jgi:hypothetical protein
VTVSVVQVDEERLWSVVVLGKCASVLRVEFRTLASVCLQQNF